MEERLKYQKKKIHALLDESDCALTRLQISRILGIERATVCRRVAELKGQGVLWVATVGLDPLTHTRAEFLTTRKDILEKYANDIDLITR